MSQRFIGLMAIALIMAYASQGLAQEGALLEPVLPAFNGEGLEAWFFSFLERLLNLFANFIGQILHQIFGGLGSMFTSTPVITNL